MRHAASIASSVPGARGWTALPALLLALSVPVQARAASGDFRVIPAYFSGDYGTGISTDITYVPFIVTASSGRNEIRVTVPYLSISTAEPVTFTGGEVIGRNGKKGASGPTTESGLGDVVVQEEYYFVQGTTHLPWISALGLLKLPTADESAGLGTGRTDYGPGATVTQPLGAGISLMVDARYWVRGSPPGVDYRNTLWTSAGLQARVSQITALNFFFDDRQSIVPGRRDLRDLSLGYERHMPKGVIFRGAVFGGLSSTAEDYGFSAGFSFGRN